MTVLRVPLLGEWHAGLVQPLHGFASPISGSRASGPEPTVRPADVEAGASAALLEGCETLGDVEGGETPGDVAEGELPCCERSALERVGRERHYVQPWPASDRTRQLWIPRLAHLRSRLRSRWPEWRVGARMPAIWRPVRSPACGYGMRVASGLEFEAQAARFDQVLQWDAQALKLLQRLESGRAPAFLDLFCGDGGVSEGGRRVGATPVGVDLSDHPGYRARFGDEWFALGDALDVELLRGLVRRLRPFAIWASPECQGYSTQTFGGAPSEVGRLIAVVRDVLTEIGLPFIIENVRGASGDMSAEALVLWGQDFGLRTSRPRLLEGGGGLRLRPSEHLAATGALLRSRCCLGRHARYPRLDVYGLPMAHACCDGSCFSVVSGAPKNSTHAQNAAAMGVDVGHMPYASLAKSIPPAYAAFAVGQGRRAMC